MFRNVRNIRTDFVFCFKKKLAEALPVGTTNGESARSDNQIISSNLNFSLKVKRLLVDVVCGGRLAAQSTASGAGRSVGTERVASAISVRTEVRTRVPTSPQL